MIIKTTKNKYEIFQSLQKVLLAKRMLIIILYSVTSSVFFFGLGVYMYREGYINSDLRQYLSNLSEVPGKLFNSYFTEVKTISIDIKYKNLERIAYQREKALTNRLHVTSEAKYVPAMISMDGEIFDAKLKLKGAHADHWVDPEKWSLKIKLKNDRTVWDMKVFSIMPPMSRGYLYEWMYQKMLMEEGFIHKQIHFVKVVINGKDNGIYVLEEDSGLELLKNNNLPESPIISFDKRLWTKESINRGGHFSMHGNTDFFSFPVKSDHPDYEDYEDITSAISLLNGFRGGSLKLKEVFEVDHIALFFAIRALFLSKEMDRKDLKFYLNPNSGKLDPVGGEVHFSEPRVGSWWINELPDISGNKELLSLFFSDTLFYKEYYSALDRILKPKYLNKFFSKIDSELDEKLNILNKEYYYKKIFNKNIVYANQGYMRTLTYPVEGIQAYYLSSDETALTLNIGNICNWPIRVLNIDIAGDKFSPQETGSVLNVKKDREPVVYETFSFNTSRPVDSDKDSIEKIKVYYRIMGSDKVQTIHVLGYQQYDHQVN